MNSKGLPSPLRGNSADARNGVRVRWRAKPEVDEFTTAANGFTASWARTHDEGNVAFSGVGCWALLALLSSAADGPARSELESAVGVPPERALDAASNVMRRLGGMPDVHAALGLWSKAVLDPTWLDNSPLGVVGDLTGDPAADKQRINAWAAEATNGEIRRLPIDLSADTLIVLASGLLVETAWTERFSELPGSWMGRPASWLEKMTADLDAVRLVATEVGATTLLSVPGRDELDVHLVYAQPAADPGEVLAAGIGALASPDTIFGTDLPDGYQGPGVRVERERSADPGDLLVVGVPAFRLQASHDLLKHAGVFGLQTATRSDVEAGHFPGMSAEPLCVDQAVQEATAEFSKGGFRAAAVTAIVMDLPDIAGLEPEPRRSYTVRRIIVRFDHPFGFVVTHRSSALVLAAGWVDEPLSSEGWRDPAQEFRELG